MSKIILYTENIAGRKQLIHCNLVHIAYFVQNCVQYWTQNIPLD